MEKFRTLFCCGDIDENSSTAFRVAAILTLTLVMKIMRVRLYARIITARARGNWRANGTHAWNWLHGYYCLALGQWIVSSVNSMVCSPVSVVT